MTSEGSESSTVAGAPAPAPEPLKNTVGFIGTGNMAEALIKGLLRAGLLVPERIWGSDPRRSRCDEMKARYGISVTTHNEDVVRRCDILILSVKPQILPAVCQEIGPQLKPHALCVSIAAGVPLGVLERLLPPGARIVRTMPNTPALVGVGATALAPGAHASGEDMDVARRIFDSVGMTVVLDEEQLDAVTGLSGSGPAYVFLMIEALSDAGVKVGLSRYNALALAAQTVLGSAKLLLDTGLHPGHLKDMVTSPGGTAIAGLHTLEEGGLRTTLINAVEAATRRSRELGEAALRAVTESQEDVTGLRKKEDGIELDLQVVPRAARPGLGPTQGDRVKVRVGAPPVDGAANEAVRALLAELLHVGRADVRIARGETGRKKTVRISGDPQALAARVEQLLGEPE